MGHSDAVTTSTPTNCLSKEKRLQEENDTLVVLIAQKQTELRDFKAKPTQLPPLVTHGNDVTQSTYDRCHNKGQQSHGDTTKKIVNMAVIDKRQTKRGNMERAGLVTVLNTEKMTEGEQLDDLLAR